MHVPLVTHLGSQTFSHSSRCAKNQGSFPYGLTRSWGSEAKGAHVYRGLIGTFLKYGIRTYHRSRKLTGQLKVETAVMASLPVAQLCAQPKEDLIRLTQLKVLLVLLRTSGRIEGGPGTPVTGVWRNPDVPGLRLLHKLPQTLLTVLSVQISFYAREPLSSTSKIPYTTSQSTIGLHGNFKKIKSRCSWRT